LEISGRTSAMKRLSKVMAAIVFLLVGRLDLAQTIAITPNSVLSDGVVAITVAGLKPGERVTIRSELVDGDNKIWSANADFIADDKGTVDLSRQMSENGSYRGVSAMGLIWSMRPSQKDTHIYRAPKDLQSQAIKFSLIEDQKEVSSASLEELFLADQVKQIRLDGALHGIFFVPDGTTKHAAVLVVGGSEGGTPVSKAAWLASDGYPALALAYFRSQGLPQKLEAIPLEYFGQALSWLSQRPEVDKDRLAVMGTSRGGELALEVGSLYPIVHAVIAYVPANVRYPACCGSVAGAAWTLKGMPLAYARPGRNRTVSSIQPMAVIPVEQTHGPILLISGRDDGIWPSSDMTNDVSRRLRQNHFAFEVERLDYPHAGHRAGLPQIIPTWSSNVTRPVSGATEDYGGTPEGNAASSLDAVPKVLEFLNKALASSKAGPAAAVSETR
jgi:dienelactone hydrolase